MASGSDRRIERLEDHSPPRPGPSAPLAVPEEALESSRPPRHSRWPRPPTPPPRRRFRARYQIVPTLGDNPPEYEGPPPYDSIDPPPPYSPFPPSSFGYVATHSERRKKKFDLKKW